MSATKSTPLARSDKRERVDFGKIAPAMELPNLISVQKESFERFMTEGLAEAFQDASPIQNSAAPRT